MTPRLETVGREAWWFEMKWRELERVDNAVTELDLPPVVFKTCPWQPRELVEAGLRQWLRCCAPAMRHRRIIGMPSHAVDEAWHGLILCTATYSRFCDRAYGRYLHHHPEGAAPAGVPGTADAMTEQLGRTVVAWTMVAKAGEECVLWDLDKRVGIDHPWGVERARVTAIEAATAGIRSESGLMSTNRRIVQGISNF